MIASMTGFARRELAGSWGTLTCELRSVNHRYLEPGFRRNGRTFFVKFSYLIRKSFG